MAYQMPNAEQRQTFSLTFPGTLGILMSNNIHYMQHNNTWQPKESLWTFSQKTTVISSHNT